jgi:hypothetical protein
MIKVYLLTGLQVSLAEFKAIVKDIDSKIETLSRTDKRNLLSLIRKTHFVEKKHISSYKDFDTERYNTYSSIHGLYEKLGLTEEMYCKHWYSHFKKQQKIHEHYNDMVKPLRKDNKTYINKGNGDSHPGKIRFPRKARKTAWKRFYKLFPALNPDNKKDK